jgi:DNA-binding response OmpR family regulator
MNTGGSKVERGGGNTIELIRWPADAERRDRCRDLGVMRLLVLEAGVEAPVCADILEDWVRAPISRDDLQARIDTIMARVSAQHAPRIDHNGVLQFRSSSVLLSPTETDLVTVLAASFREVVSRKELLEILPGTSQPSRNALDLHMMRIRRRVKALGLEIHAVWGRGYILRSAGASD